MNFYELLESDLKDNNKYREVIEITKNFLINSRGRVEGQRIKKITFEKYDQNWEAFEQNNILSSQDLYNFITNENEYCPSCENGVRRWRGCRDGYVSQCIDCSRVNNWITNISEENKIRFDSLKEVLKYIKDKNGNQNTSKLKKIHDETIELIKNSTMFITWDASLSERLFCIENKITTINDLPKCCTCKEPVTRFYSSNKGYWTYHQGECANDRKRRAYESNKKVIQQNIRRSRSTKVVERMKSLPKNTIRIKDFDFEEYVRTGTDFITLKCNNNHIYDIDNHYQGDFRCEKCYPRRSRTQNEIFDFIEDFDSNVKDNNRKIIDPLEIDIVSFKYNFGIEYNSQNYHSDGYTKDNFLKNIDKNLHLTKTNMSDEMNFHLFHVFSSEYLDPIKKEIWHSMFRNKMGRTNKIFARKCIVREITSKELKSFSELNHIQGHVNARIRLGLFYEDELVQVMSFSSPRQSKYKGNNNYELMRMCTLINHNVIGGASKLLKFFERNYKPELIISYANRRWTYKENVYQKLGFKLDNITPPNYFYYKGGDNGKLESRVKYQKHKLKHFDSYSDDLTEFEIMVKEKYRRIYDSGNYVYIKTY